MTIDPIEEELERYIEEREEDINGDKPFDLLALKVLRSLWCDMQVLKEHNERHNRNPSLIYLLRYQFAKTSSSLFSIFVIGYIILSFLSEIVGLEDIVKTVLP